MNKFEKKPFTIGAYIEMLTSERPVGRIVVIRPWWR